MLPLSRWLRPSRSRSTYCARVSLCQGRPFRAVGVLLVAVLAATSCSSSGSDSAAVTATQPGQPLLAPATTPPLSAPADQSPIVPPEPTPIASIVGCLSTREQAAQLLMPLATQPELAGAIEAAAAGELGWLGLLGTPDEGLVAALVELQAAAPIPVLVASDEEGGTVQRLSGLLGPLPSAASDATTKSPDQVRQQWVEYGTRVRELGIQVILGPVLDVGSGPGIESRSYGDDPAVVAAYGRAVAEGLIEAGVLPVFKHFPGHGRATADSHLLLPTTPPLDELRTLDLVPYVELLQDPVFEQHAGVMIGHLSVPGLSEDGLPTSLSPATINGLLQTELGYTGLVFSDAMNMGAIVNEYGVVDALERSFRAGLDVAILGSLAEISPALDHLVSVADTDPAFAALIEDRATRVLVAKDQAEFCLGVPEA